MTDGDAKQSTLERELEEMREQLRKNKEEMKRKEEESKEQLKKKDEEMERKEEEAKIKEDESTEQLKKKEEEMMRKEEELQREKEESRKKDEELARLRKQPTGPIGFLDEGSIEYEAEAVEKDSYSPYKTIGGLPFRVSLQVGTGSGIKCVGIYVYCNENSAVKTWSARVTYTLTLKSSVTPSTRTYSNTFRPTASSWGPPEFEPWAEAVDPSKGFVQNGHFKIEAQIKLIWFYNNAIADFSSSDAQLSDVTLLVGEKALHANRHYLAHFSEYFKALFLSGFAENMDTVKLPEVDAKEFEELLKIIHPQKEKAKVTKDNVAYLLRLADFFDVPFVLWACIEYLKGTRDFPLAAKLKLTEEIRLPELQNNIIAKIGDLESVKKVIDSVEFKTYSEPLKNFVLQKYYDKNIAMQTH